MRREIEEIAIVAHEVNRAYCIACGDISHVAWEHTSDETKDSVIAGVEFKLDNHNATPEESHNSWFKFKIEHGWVFGEEKSTSSKTHPCLVAYEDLPTEQQAKDHIFHAIVMSLWAANEPTGSTGEQRVEVSFNPSGNPAVDYIKRGTADIIDDVMSSGGGGRASVIACTKYEEACMWAVKSITNPNG